MQQVWIRTLHCLTILTVVFTTVSIALADEPAVSLTVTPVVAAVTVPAGSTTNVLIHVTNTTKQDQTFEAVLSDYQGLGTEDSQIQYVSAGTQADSIAAFASTVPSRFSMAAGETKTITVQISPGTNQAPGRYRGAILLGPTTAFDTATNQSQLSVSGKVATLIGVTVSAPLVQSGTVGTIGQFASSHASTLWALGAAVLFVLIVAYMVAKRRT